MSIRKFWSDLPKTNFGLLNLDWILQHFGNLDDRLQKAEEKNVEQDDRLDQDEADIADLRTDLTAETNARIAADNGLSNRIDAEASARQAADNAEKSAREAADRQIEADLAAETSARIAGDNGLSSRIDAEVSARQAADTAESNARQAADTALGNRINTIEPVIIEATVSGDVTTITSPTSDIELAEQPGRPAFLRITGPGATNIFTKGELILAPGGIKMIRFYRDDEVITINDARSAGGGLTVIDEIKTIAANVSYPVPTTDLTSLMVGGTNYKVPEAGSDVVANDTSGTAGGDLSSLKVGDTSYTIPQGGQGTTVVANPSGAATEDLSKIQIGSTIYNVPSVVSGAETQGDFSGWTGQQEGGTSFNISAFTNLVPNALYVITYDLYFFATGTDVNDIEWDLRFNNVHRVETHSNDFNAVGQCIVKANAYGNITMGMNATNTTDDFYYNLQTAVASATATKL